MARLALIDNDIIGIFRNSPFVYGNISTHICSRNMAASVAINITAQTSAVYGNRSEIPFIFPIIMPKSIVSEFSSSQHCLFAVQGISQRLFSSTSITTIPMHSTSIVKNLHDKSTSTVRLVYQNAIFDTSHCVAKGPEAERNSTISRFFHICWATLIAAHCANWCLLCCCSGYQSDTSFLNN